MNGCSVHRKRANEVIVSGSGGVEPAVPLSSLPLLLPSLAGLSSAQFPPHHGGQSHTKRRRQATLTTASTALRGAAHTTKPTTGAEHAVDDQWARGGIESSDSCGVADCVCVLAVLCSTGLCSAVLSLLPLQTVRIYFSENAYTTVPATSSTTVEKLCQQLHRKRQLPEPLEQYAMFVTDADNDRQWHNTGSQNKRNRRRKGTCRAWRARANGRCCSLSLLLQSFPPPPCRRVRASSGGQ